MDAATFTAITADTSSSAPMPTNAAIAVTIICVVVIAVIIAVLIAADR